MNKSVWSFLLPHLDGSVFAGVQIFFALVCVAAIVAVAVLLPLHARPIRWERRLAALDDGDQQVPLHDTPEALSQAVATAAERWADILPSLLLVFGLLGTFIGIGLALSEAAVVLGGADAFGHLTPIILTLGTKFKIATWGIVAFLFLRVWLTVFPYEQARMAWSTKQVKARAAQAVQRQAQQEAAARQQLVDAISRSGNALLNAQQAEAQRAHIRHAELLEALLHQASQAPQSRQAEDAR